MTHTEIIDQVHAAILKEWTQSELKNFFLTGLRDDETLSRYHMNLGRYIRNKYSLWNIPWTPEIRDGVDYSPFHPDAVSNTIIAEVWKKGLPYGN